VLALIINVVVVVYLLRAKRLRGLAAERAQDELDEGWPALERSAPASVSEVQSARVAPRG
jgi:hypothetical protein